jgi:hypothetical protein
VARGKQLKDELAAREERQAQEAPAAAAQVAAEHGVTHESVDQLMAQVQRHWNDSMELTKDMAEAGRRKVAHRQVDGPTGGMVRFDAMVTARIAELKEQARQAELNGPSTEHQRSVA